MSIFEGKDKRMLALAMALGVVNSVASAFVAILLAGTGCGGAW